MLGITLSNGVKYTPSTNTSVTTPIVLPVAGQSFADIGMLVPAYTNSVALNSLIGPPYNYWGDDDGDTDVTATGSLSLSIVDKYNQPVTRHTVPDICKAPYQVKLTSTDGTLSTRYGVPSSRIFSASNVTYYINPQARAVVCFARPNLTYFLFGWRDHVNEVRGPASIWNENKGFLTQSTNPSSYGLNFPTTGANNLYFDLDIAGSNEALSWTPVTYTGITATMTNSSRTGVRVTLTRYGLNSLLRPSLPQTFELVGRDSRGNEVVKYGFVLKQWFYTANRHYSYNKALSGCSDVGLRLATVKDLTNASCNGLNVNSECRRAVGATPSSPNNYFQRVIGAGFFSEWGSMSLYSKAAFGIDGYWTSEGIEHMLPGKSRKYTVNPNNGSVAASLFSSNYLTGLMVCVWP